VPAAAAADDGGDGARGAGLVHPPRRVVRARQLRVGADGHAGGARRDPARAEEALTRAAADARHAIQDLRDLVNGVHPLVLTDRGVAVALEELTASAPIAVHLDVTEERFPPEVEAAAYFTVAEALTNVVKHADAYTAEVTIRRDGDVLTIEVADDGRGGADLAAGSGLRGLQDRLAVLGGALEVVETGADGTRVRGVVPLPGGA
jgi:signal transduction histidine kinase